MAWRATQARTPVGRLSRLLWVTSTWPKEYLPKHINEAKHQMSDPICPQLAAMDRDIPGERMTTAQIVTATLTMARVYGHATDEISIRDEMTLPTGC